MEQKKSRAAEVIRFALTGGVCFLVELAVLVLLKGRFGVDTLIATPIAFLISVILNYLLCVIWVFRGAKNRGAGAKAGFLITSLIGLGLNELILYVCVDLIYGNWTQLQALMHPRAAELLAKIGATGIVMVYNFVTRKIFMEKKD